MDVSLEGVQQGLGVKWLDLALGQGTQTSVRFVRQLLNILLKTEFLLGGREAEVKVHCAH